MRLKISRFDQPRPEPLPEGPEGKVRQWKWRNCDSLVAAFGLRTSPDDRGNGAIACPPPARTRSRTRLAQWPAGAQCAAGPGSARNLAGGIAVSLRYLHTMVRVTDIERSLDFYCNKLGMQETHRREDQAGVESLIGDASLAQAPAAWPMCPTSAARRWSARARRS